MVEFKPPLKESLLDIKTNPKILPGDRDTDSFWMTTQGYLEPATPGSAWTFLPMNQCISFTSLIKIM